MDPKIFEKKLSEIVIWHRVDEYKIYRRPEEVDPAHYNPQIEVLEIPKKLYPCDWCQKRMCTNRRSLHKSMDPQTGQPIWNLYCSTCKCYWDPQRGRLSAEPRPDDGIIRRGRPKKFSDNK